MTDKIRVALVGVGVMGSKYADMIVSGEVQNMVLTGVVARNLKAQAYHFQKPLFQNYPL